MNGRKSVFSSVFSKTVGKKLKNFSAVLWKTWKTVEKYLFLLFMEKQWKFFFNILSFIRKNNEILCYSLENGGIFFLLIMEKKSVGFQKNS